MEINDLRKFDYPSECPQTGHLVVFQHLKPCHCGLTPRRREGAKPAGGNDKIFSLRPCVEVQSTAKLHVRAYSGVKTARFEVHLQFAAGRIGSAKYAAFGRAVRFFIF
jgi:hypothetical protein